MKCESCGALFKINTVSKVLKCPYCGREAKNLDYVESSVVNDTHTTTYVTQYAPPRPRVRAGLAILLFIFYIFPGIIYVLVVRQRKINWDRRYKK
jgi:uncharacterized OB-fold protein